MSEVPEASTADVLHDNEDPHEAHNVPGTVVLTLIFLACFAIYYFANWKALADVWHVR